MPGQRDNFTLENFSMRAYQETITWQVVYEHGVSYRSSESYGDRAAGKGPQKGDILQSVGAPREGDGVWYIKTQVGPTYMYVPMNTKNEPNRPVVRPYEGVSSNTRSYKVVYPSGVDWRVSRFYNDKDDGAPQGPMQGDVVKGKPMSGDDGWGSAVPFIMVDVGQYLPLATKDGKPILEEFAEPEPAPAPAPMPVPVAVGYPPQPPQPPAPQQEWTEHSSNGRPYWYNTRTQQTTWTNPHAPVPAPYRPPPPAVVNGWARLESNGRPYWAHTVTRETTWKDPTAWQTLDSNGRPYYYNAQTNQTVWDRPY